jgi:hypothetical protein
MQQPGTNPTTVIATYRDRSRRIRVEPVRSPRKPLSKPAPAKTPPKTKSRP